MSNPIKPESVEVDRECEHRWIEKINTELAKPWGGNEVSRYIEVEGVMSKQSLLVRWVADQFSEAGWFVDTASSSNAPDKYATLKFTRPQGDTQ